MREHKNCLYLHLFYHRDGLGSVRNGLVGGDEWGSGSKEEVGKGEVTINVPLFKKLRDIIFLVGQFRGQKSRDPFKMSREMDHKVIVPQKKIMSQSFTNSGTLLLLCVVVC